MNDKRPDPDKLLDRVKMEAALEKRGKLKIFFGASPGVGKTFAMLEAARAKKNEGLDVVVGLLETHGRKETAALLEGLEILPPQELEYRGTQLKEFDIDAALKRRPDVLLVDELAHTNAPGARHLKRWQDVQELLDLGVNVYSTLNVQHLESLNDIVAQITGVTVRETLPDKVLQEADEVELIDLPPDDLLKRLQEGKVYMAEAAQRAVQNFFKKGNLIALREMALRTTADRVNDQVQDYRRTMAITQTWATSDRILVCVSPSPSSANLVRAAHRMAKSLRSDWIALYVEIPSRGGDEARSQAIQHLRLAEQLGAETATLTGSDFAEEVMDYAKERNVTKIFIGKPPRYSWRNLLRPSPVDRLLRASGDIDIYATRGESADPRAPERPRFQGKAAGQGEWKGYLYALLGVAASTLICSFIYEWLDLANLIMVYLLGVLAVSYQQSRGPSTLASVLSVLAFDFFFVPPRFTFAVSDTQYIVVFLVMLVVGLSISNLTVRVRDQARHSRLRERRTAALYALSRELASTWGTAELLDIAVKHIAEVFESSVIAFLPDEHGRLKVQCGDMGAFDLTSKEMGVAHWAFDLGQPAGRGTDTLPGTDALYLPLLASGAPVGALGVKPRHPEKLFIPEQLHLLEAFAHQTALAVAADKLLQKQQQTQMEVESEKLRSSLLSSVSHDLRTPLAAITGSISSLLQNGESFPAPTRRDLLENIHDESERLERLVNNLLEMTKLESGSIQPNRELNHPAEVIGSALARLDKKASARKITTRIPPDLPLVPMDSLLIEQVLVNLVDNALKYTPPDSPVEIIAGVGEGFLEIEVADRGPGLPEADLPRLFEKFYRGPEQGRAAGAGLGLSICKGFVQIHGGSIEARNRPGGGAVFRFTLPLEAGHGG
ncbi:MAG TPA: sensor histidine kinase KdpD [bacterium]|nr:sensor histidine kinase KdpD [bacterium]